MYYLPACYRDLFRIIMFLEIWQNSQENICARVFLIKFLASGLRPETFLKRDSVTDVFLEILHNF